MLHADHPTDMHAGFFLPLLDFSLLFKYGVDETPGEVLHDLCVVHDTLSSLCENVIGDNPSRSKFPFQVWDFGLLAQTLSRWASANFNFTSDDILIYIEMKKN